MFSIIRFVLLGILFFAVWKAIRYISHLTEANRYRQTGGRSGQSPDPSKEVRNASYKSEDVQDANFKDIK